MINSKIFGDGRGFFSESFNQAKFKVAIGRLVNFVQDIHSKSVKHVLRGLNYHIQQTQDKLVSVVLSNMAKFFNKITDYWSPEFERSIAWNDPRIEIKWPFSGEASLSSKDKLAGTLANAEQFA